MTERRKDNPGVDQTDSPTTHSLGPVRPESQEERARSLSVTETAACDRIPEHDPTAAPTTPPPSSRDMLVTAPPHASAAAFAATLDTTARDVAAPDIAAPDTATRDVAAPDIATLDTAILATAAPDTAALGPRRDQAGAISGRDNRATPNTPPTRNASSQLGAALAPGAQVRDYVIQEMLAQGGFGVVYRAVHRILGRTVAIKLLHADLAHSAEAVERFIREARATGSLSHPHIVTLYDFGILDDGRPYQVMELASGTDLERLVRQRGRMPPARVLAVLDPICRALGAAHTHGIVHRDIKASNVMVDTQTEPWTIKLLDFGIAKLLTANTDGWATSRGRIIGTPLNMAPEQIRGEPVDRRTDIYALGVLAFQLLTGRMPFPTADASLVHQLHLSAPPPAPSQFAPLARAQAQAVDTAVLRAMSKHPAERPDSADLLLQELQAALAPIHPGASPQSLGPTSAPPAAAMRSASATEADSDHDRASDSDPAVKHHHSDEWAVGIHLKAEFALPSTVPLSDNPDAASESTTPRQLTAGEIAHDPNAASGADRLFDRLGALLDFIEDELIDAGFGIGLATRNAFVAVLPCRQVAKHTPARPSGPCNQPLASQSKQPRTDAPSSQRQAPRPPNDEPNDDSGAVHDAAVKNACRWVLDYAQRLLIKLRQHPAADPAIEFALCLHVDRIRARSALAYTSTHKFEHDSISIKDNVLKPDDSYRDDDHAWVPEGRLLDLRLWPQPRCDGKVQYSDTIAAILNT